MSSAPSPEPAANGPDVGACVREALEALTQRQGHDALGRFTAGNLGAGRTLERSEAFWNAVAPARDAIARRVAVDLAADEHAAETLTRLITAYAEASLFRESMFIRLVEHGGPITGKGKTRALYGAYLHALDREMKLAQILGLERRPKRVESLADLLARHEDADG